MSLKLLFPPVAQSFFTMWLHEYASWSASKQQLCLGLTTMGVRERARRFVSVSRVCVCVFVGCGRIIAAEFTKQKKGSTQLELY